MAQEDPIPNIAKVYDEQVHTYTQFTTSSFSWGVLERPAIEQNLSAICNQELKILDAGCGGGRVIKHLISLGALPINIIGVDISSGMLEIAKAELPPQVKLVKASLSEVELEPGYLDLVTSSMVLHYLDEEALEQTMRKFYQSLKPKGTLFYIVPHPMRYAIQYSATYLQKGWQEEITPWDTKIPFFHRPVSDFINQTSQAGFNIRRVIEPTIDDRFKELDPESYDRYTRYGPSRLVVVAEK